MLPAFILPQVRLPLAVTPMTDLGHIRTLLVPEDPGLTWFEGSICFDKKPEKVPDADMPECQWMGS